MSRLTKSVVALAVLAGLGVGLYFLLPRRVDPLAGAREAIARRDFATARKELDNVLQQNETNKEALHLAARTARRDGDMAAAEAFLKRFVDAGGTQEEAELERALRESQEGNVRNADRVIRHCSDYPDDPNGPFMLEALAIGLLKAGPPPKTIECLDLWLSRSISPADRVQALVWRGRALQQQGLAPDAADEFRKALAIDDSKTEARLLLAQFLTRHEPEIAMVHFVRLDADLPGNKDVRFGLARCHRQLGNLKEAEKLLNGLLTEYPDDVPMLIEAGALALDGGRADQAEKHLRKALTLRPKSRDANVQLARCLQDLGREAEANEQRERIKKLDEELFGKYDDPARKP